MVVAVGGRDLDAEREAARVEPERHLGDREAEEVEDGRGGDDPGAADRAAVAWSDPRMRLVEQDAVAAEDVAENQQKAAALLDMPFGDWLLIGVGLIVAGVGIGNMVRGFRSDFSSDLACSADICRLVVPVG